MKLTPHSRDHRELEALTRGLPEASYATARRLAWVLEHQNDPAAWSGAVRPPKYSPLAEDALARARRLNSSTAPAASSPARTVAHPTG